MARTKLEIPVRGMDCAECTLHVQHALADLPGVEDVHVLLSSEKAVLQIDPSQVDLPTIRKAVEGAGYTVPEPQTKKGVEPNARSLTTFTRPILTLFGIIFGVVLIVVIVGEWLGLFERVTEWVPWYIGWGLVLLAGYPIFWNVIRAALHRQVISHTLMSIGVIAALAVGQWPTALVIVFFMHIGDYVEHFTAERSRQAVKRLTALAPQTARVERDGVEQVVPIEDVQVGETVIVRPGESIPVDGEVTGGQATVNQATLTGESMPVEVSSGHRVYAATIATLGSIRLKVTQVGADTTFGRVITMVEEAEAHRAPVQRIADRFSAYFLPVVATIALITFLVSRNPLSVASVLVVACSCSFALATPIAMLASIGAAASRGILVKGGKYLESLSHADVLLIDKTGTITTGQPQITDVIALAGHSQDEVLALAASVERDSEHPLAEAVRQAAAEHMLALSEQEHFEAIPGLGVRAEVNGVSIAVGNARMMASSASLLVTQELERQGKTLLLVEQADKIIGVLAAADTIRPEVPAAIERLRTLGISTIELLTGDNERTAEAQARALRITYRAELLPEDKIRIVKEYQAQGHTVVMIGDGVNDAPALAQADVGIAMGVIGSDVALEAAHVALMREEWNLVPDVFTIAKRTMRVVKMNLSFTILYNLVGLSLAALGLLPPILAAAAQSLPDLGILANSSRLLRQKLPTAVRPGARKGRHYISPRNQGRQYTSPQDSSTAQGITETCGCGNEDCCQVIIRD